MKIGNIIQIQGNNNLVLQDVNSRNVVINFEVSKYLNMIPSIEFREIFGRESEIEKINKIFKREEKVVLVNGLGGIGKTTLALAYLKKYESQFNHIVWVHCQPSIKESIANDKGLAANLFLDFKEESVSKRLEDILNALSNLKGNNLIILDDFLDSDNSFLQNDLAILKDWRILSTSRYASNIENQLRIGALSKDDSFRLFYHYYNLEKNDSDLSPILEEVQGHTLMIELLAKTGQANNFSIKELRQKLESIEIESRRSQSTITYIEDMFNASFLELTIQEKSCLLAFSILPVISYSSEDISLFLQRLAVSFKSNSEIASTLCSLKNKGWLDSTKELFKIHPLIQQVILSKLNPKLVIKTTHDVEKFKEEVKSLVAKNQLEDAIIRLIQNTKGDSHHNELILFSSRLEELNQKVRLEIIFEKDAMVMRNQVRYGILVLIEKIEEIMIENPA